VIPRHRAGNGRGRSSPRSKRATPPRAEFCPRHGRRPYQLATPLLSTPPRWSAARCVQRTAPRAALRAPARGQSVGGNRIGLALQLEWLNRLDRDHSRTSASIGAISTSPGFAACSTAPPRSPRHR
jgi:hypothetical protein